MSYVQFLACVICSSIACLMCSFLACLMCSFLVCLMCSFLACLICSFLACLVCSFLACLVCSSGATSSPLKRLVSLASLADLLRHVALCTGGYVDAAIVAPHSGTHRGGLVAAEEGVKGRKYPQHLIKLSWPALTRPQST